MATKTISALDAAGPLDGTEVVPIVQAGTTKKVALSAILAQLGLTAENVRDIVGATLVQGTGVTIAVDDAGDTITISATGTGAATSGISGTFGPEEDGIPGASAVPVARTSVHFRAVGGGQGDLVQLFVLTEANYLVNQADLVDYVLGLTPTLTLTIGSQGFATGTIGTIAAGSFVVAMRVGASIAAPIYLYENAS